MSLNHKGTVRLETERLILRPFVLQDAAAIYRNWASDSEVTKYLTWQPHPSVEASMEYIKFCQGLYEQPNGYQWGIECKETHELIGNISVVNSEENIDSLELGWVVGRAYWGQGIMTEAAKKVIQFLFEEIGANRVCALHDVKNPASGRVMQKAGMQFEGISRGGARDNQGIVDVARYAILRADYQE